MSSANWILKVYLATGEVKEFECVSRKAAWYVIQTWDDGEIRHFSLMKRGS